jgi:hypothetical protein
MALAGWILLPQAVATGQDSSQPAKPPVSQGPKKPRSRTRSIDDQVKGFAKNLDLNETQQAQVKAILERRQEQSRRIWNDHSVPVSDRIGRYRALNDGTVAQIRSILNEEQKKKYDPLAHRKDLPTTAQPSVEDWMNATRPKK